MVLKTSLRAFQLMCPTFLMMAAALHLGERFVSNSGLLGAKFIIYSFITYYTHQAILTGEFDMGKGPSGRSVPGPFKLRFLGLVFMVAWLPMLIGAILGLIILPDPAAYGFIPLGFVTVTTLWLSLSFFGTRIPNYIWKDVTTDDNLNAAKKRTVWPFVAGGLLLWNTLYLVIAAAAITGIFVLQNSEPVLSNPVIDVGLGILIEMFPYIAVTLTAAVLSHAHLRAYDLGPQGLVETP